MVTVILTTPTPTIMSPVEDIGKGFMIVAVSDLVSDHVTAQRCATLAERDLDSLFHPISLLVVFQYQ
jgi:hypothetical protein